MPAVVARFAHLPRGLVLVTGPTGSGKTTTLACHARPRQPHPLARTSSPSRTRSSSCTTHKRCLVNQREVGVDTARFAAALKHALRQDPDIILVGELRDLETTSTALTAAETGHLVLATLHTQSAAQTIDRVIDIFPPHQQQQIRAQLSTALQGVVTQALAPRADGTGRAVVTEIMFATPAIRNLIREGKNHQIPSFMQSCGADGHARRSTSTWPSGSATARSSTFEQALETLPLGRRIHPPRRTGVITMPADQDLRLPDHRRRRQADEGHGRGAQRDRRRADRCAQQGVTPLDDQRGRHRCCRQDLKIPGLGGRVTLKDLAIFARQFATMTALRACRCCARWPILEEQTPEPRLAEGRSREVRRDIEGGIVAVGRARQARQGLPAADGRDDPGRRDRRFPRRRARAHRDRTSRRTPNLARQDQVRADLPGDRVWLQRS